ASRTADERSPARKLARRLDRGHLLAHVPGMVVRMFAFAGALAGLAGLVGLAGCPHRGGGGPVAAPGVGCPAAAGVFVASYLAPEGGQKQGHTGWVLPLHDKVVDTL